MNIFTKIIRGDEVRPTRLHTEAGTFTGLAALPGLIPAALSWVRYRTNSHYSLLGGCGMQFGLWSNNYSMMIAFLKSVPV
jgi:hypothetical protein